MKAISVRRALLSVSDKKGIVDFARGLRELGVEILSTGGTAGALREAAIGMRDVGEFTGHREMLGGRVKTLHPAIHAGILFRRGDPSDVRSMEERGFVPIDLVAVNLYPFEETVARPGVRGEEAVEEIDIGGPTLLRSAAKNHEHVAVASSPDQYGEILAEMRSSGGATSLELRRRLARAAFARTAAYDRAIAAWFRTRDPAASTEGELELPATLEISLPRARILRYGENPHQRAALYGGFLERFEQLHGRDLSYNNLLDLAAATELAGLLGRRGAAAVIIKHSNPCGAAVGATLADAWRDALATDPQSASGGIVVSSRGVDEEAAEAMSGHFIELLAAPSFSDAALEILRRKKNRILLAAKPELREPAGGELVLRSLPGGLLAQTADTAGLDDEDMRVVTRRAPTDEEVGALRFAWDVVRCVRSNAIVYASSARTLGIGAGQMSRVDSARFAVLKAKEAGLGLEGSVVASDAFFPFADGLLAAADAGATAAIQPGGSVRDREVIAAADSRDMAMVFTGRRHFRH